MKCPTCGSQMFLLRSVHQNETLALDENGCDVDVVNVYVTSVQDEQFQCSNSAGEQHTFPAEWDDDAEVYIYG
jgi:hypothetical protein